MATEQPALHLLYRHIDDMNAPSRQAGPSPAADGSCRTRAPQELAAAGCPVLLIAGDEDIVTPPFAATPSPPPCRAHARSTSPDAGYSAYFERARLFNRHVAEFLERVG